MEQDSKRIYRIFAQSFIGLGLGFLLVDIAEEIFAFSFFKGNPFPVAVLLIAIGAGLLWTIRKGQDD